MQPAGVPACLAVSAHVLLSLVLGSPHTTQLVVQVVVQVVVQAVGVVGVVCPPTPLRVP
jgi:hypothetical protein